MEQIPNPPGQLLPGLLSLSSKTSLNKRSRFLARSATSLDYFRGGGDTVPASLGQIQASLCGSAPGTQFVLDNATELAALINVRCWGGRGASKQGRIAHSNPRGCWRGDGAVLGGWAGPNPLEMISAKQEGDSGLHDSGTGTGRKGKPQPASLPASQH